MVRFVAVSLFFIMSCGPEPAPQPPTVAGTYRGTMNGEPRQLEVVAEGPGVVSGLIEPGCRVFFRWSANRDFQAEPLTCAEPPLRQVTSGFLAPVGRQALSMEVTLEEGGRFRRFSFYGDRL